MKADPGGNTKKEGSQAQGTSTHLALPQFGGGSTSRDTKRYFRGDLFLVFPHARPLTCVHPQLAQLAERLLVPLGPLVFPPPMLHMDAWESEVGWLGSAPARTSCTSIRASKPVLVSSSVFSIRSRPVQKSIAWPCLASCLSVSLWAAGPFSRLARLLPVVSCCSLD